MDNDDQQVGYLLTRREMIKVLGAIGVSLLAGCRPGASGTATPGATAATTVAATATPGIEGQTVAAVTAAPTVQAELTAEMATAETTNLTPVPDCVVRPALTEGPYFVDTQLNRADIRSDPASGAISEASPWRKASVMAYWPSVPTTPMPATIHVCSACNGCQPGHAKLPAPSAESTKVRMSQSLATGNVTKLPVASVSVVLTSAVDTVERSVVNTPTTAFCPLLRAW